MLIDRIACTLCLLIAVVARAIREDAKMLARILVVTASNDVAQLYIPMMNCIFSSQKQVCGSVIETFSSAHALRSSRVLLHSL